MVLGGGARTAPSRGPNREGCVASGVKALAILGTKRTGGRCDRGGSLSFDDCVDVRLRGNQAARGCSSLAAAAFLFIRHSGLSEKEARRPSSPLDGERSLLRDEAAGLTAPLLLGSASAQCIRHNAGLYLDAVQCLQVAIPGRRRLVLL